jgi:hypothetical protein
VLLDRAISLGDSLSHAFNTQSGIPFSDVNLQGQNGFNPHNGPSSLAEAGSLQLEFSYLAKLAYNDELRRKVITITIFIIIIIICELVGVREGDINLYIYVHAKCSAFRFFFPYFDDCVFICFYMFVCVCVKKIINYMVF